jgi:SAM-dependent methyltransferase
MAGHQHSHAGHAAGHIDWAEAAAHLVANAADDRPWYESLARELVGPADRLAVDVGCGGAGMAIALAGALPHGRVVAVDEEPAILEAARSNVADAGVPVDVVRADLQLGFDQVRTVLAGPADLVWASASVHHLSDQQAAVTDLAGLLAPGGRLALAEGGLPHRHLPWEIGLGEPGLELRLQVAEDRWFAAMRAALPDVRPMPYSWAAALRRAGLDPVTTRTKVLETPVPLGDADRERVVDRLTHRVERAREADLLNADDVAVWARLLDPADTDFLGRREDLADLVARSVHIGVKPT